MTSRDKQLLLRHLKSARMHYQCLLVIGHDFVNNEQVMQALNECDETIKLVEKMQTTNG